MNTDGELRVIYHPTREDAQMAIKVLENTSDRGDWDGALIFAAKRVLMAYFNVIAAPMMLRVKDEKQKDRIKERLLAACELALQFWFTDHPNDTGNAFDAHQEVMAAVTDAKLEAQR